MEPQGAPGVPGTTDLPQPHDATQGLAGTFAACLGVLLLGLVALFHGTQGGSAYTTETQRRSAVAQAPQQVPDFSVVDAQGQAHTLRNFLAQGERVWIVDFIYTRCQTLCLTLGTVFQQLQAQLQAEGLQGRVGLLSISFDPEQDRPEALARYAQRMQMDPALWQTLSLANPADRRQLLDSFGIMVVPAPLGEFEHNAALHIVTSDGHLVRILGLDESPAAVRAALALASAQP